jgi:4-hydroxythreonine-4-phosphate dehydrogenase
MNPQQEKPALAITMGDVNGIGPEVLARALARPEARAVCRPVVFGSARVLEEARVFAPAMPPLAAITALEELPALDPARIAVFEGGWPAPAVRAGHLDPEAGRCAIEWVKLAVGAAQAGVVTGLVTCPISKECIYKAGYHYIGHTELVAELSSAHDYRMCLFTDTMRIVHITGHLSLRDALDYVRKDRIVASARIGDQALKRLGFARPRIAVAGLNPHAGEAGAFGREEIEEIAPAVAACRAEGIDASGPYPPDTLFGKMRAGEFDMVIAMYHDQGHIPLKLIAMDEGVNVTLGTPLVRTSVDHGTAFDIAWQGKAREHSLIAAITLAARLSSVQDKD